MKKVKELKELKKFFVEGIGTYVLEDGLDALKEYVKKHYPIKDVPLSENDRAVLEHFRSAVPNTYQRVGILFEVLVVETRDGKSSTMIVPRGFGDSPTGAVINEGVFNEKDIPELPKDTKDEWARRRVEIAELMERDDVTVDRTAVWWELDRTSREWSVRHADLKLAEEQARRAIVNGKSLADLSRAAPTINALRANAAQWLSLREHTQSRIREEYVRSQIQSLADANESMVLQIDAALADLKRAQEFQGFLSAINTVGALFKLGAVLSDDASKASKDRMVALENHSITVIEHAGNEMRRIDVKLKNIFGGYIDDKNIMPSFDIKTIRRITRPL
ncbi:MAG: hypothetical protein E5X65_20695 [Mesorhizobium sp.]|nr:MAG: hypothetical protein E5X65_20695 [Mesorhizobium sp.]